MPFDAKLNQRTCIDTSTNCSAAHGSNLAAVLSALRNTNGQLVPINRLQKLGRLRASGATPVNYLVFFTPLKEFVFTANLQFGGKAIATVNIYARGEACQLEATTAQVCVRKSSFSLATLTLYLVCHGCARGAPLCWGQRAVTRRQSCGGCMLGMPTRPST